MFKNINSKKITRGISLLYSIYPYIGILTSIVKIVAIFISFGEYKEYVHMGTDSLIIISSVGLFFDKEINNQKYWKLFFLFFSIQVFLRHSIIYKYVQVNFSVFYVFYDIMASTSPISVFLALIFCGLGYKKSDKGLAYFSIFSGLNFLGFFIINIVGAGLGFFAWNDIRLVFLTTFAIFLWFTVLNFKILKNRNI